MSGAHALSAFYPAVARLEERQVDLLDEAAGQRYLSVFGREQIVERAVA